MKKRIVCLLLTMMIGATQIVSVAATTESEIKAQQAEAKSELNQTNAVLDDLNDKQVAIQGEISDLDADLVDLMIQISTAKQDIADTETKIQQTTEDLAAAEADRDEQYEAMKKRIQYIYESGGDATWAKMLLEADSIASLLNRAEYAQKLHDYDRNSLEQYVAVVNQVSDLKASLEQQKADLEAQQAELEKQEANLQAQLEEKKATSSDYDAQISTAQQQAAEIENLIAQQQAELERLEQERIAAERAAAEEAARQAAAEAQQQESARQEAAQQRQEEETVTTTNSSSSSSGSSSSSSGSSSSSSSSSSDESYSPGGSSGSSIVAYADQFVGNPYVWGGNSLTNGIDCSHFVYQVLKNCGVYSGGYTTSGGWRSLGRAVSSLSEAKAGDVICYSGHVAIYDGSGGIVEAKGSKWGITHDRSADHATILAIRRFT